MGVLLVGGYSGSLYATYRRGVRDSQNLHVPSDVSDRYNHTASSFDSEVNLAERVMRLSKRRRELVALAHGDVLEVSCGTGRNMDYYQFGERRTVDEQGRATIRGCRTVTFVDLCEPMVEIARRKFDETHPNNLPVQFCAQDAKQVQPPRYKKRPYFDTIVQTMGLCSLPDPVGTLRHLATLVEPENGKILLLEHGRSYYGWLNGILDNLAPAHADKHGCWWNRDIRHIVQQSGLEVVREKRWHLGTTWMYVLRVRKAEGAK